MPVVDQATLQDALAEAVASGRASAPLALLAETQAALAPRARAALGAAEAIASARFEGEAAAPVALSDAVLARLDAIGQEQPAKHTQSDALAAELARLPAPLRDVALQAAASGARWTFAAPGLRSLLITDDNGVRAEVLRIQPGHGAPTHTHEGSEYTLVLEGAFHDGHAHYGVGDISFAHPDLTHRPIATPGPVCYAFAVTEAPLRFKGALGVVQRLFS